VDARRPEGRFLKSQRVRSRREFQAIQSAARRVVTGHFVMLICARSVPEGAKASGPRLGVTASRKVGNSVLRNRAKRLVREAFRATRSLWAPEIDVVIIVRHFDNALGLHDVTREWIAARAQIEKRCREATRTTGGSS
jgi:ribonuclease P protein component